MNKRPMICTKNVLQLENGALNHNIPTVNEYWEGVPETETVKKTQSKCFGLLIFKDHK